jgi:hypothetical protein
MVIRLDFPDSNVLVRFPSERTRPTSNSFYRCSARGLPTYPRRLCDESDCDKAATMQMRGRNLCIDHVRIAVQHCKAAD